MYGALLLVMMTGGVAQAQQEPSGPYALVDAFTEEQAYAMGGHERIISKTRAIGRSGCFDTSGAEPVKLNDHGLEHPFRLGDNVYHALEGVEHLLVRSRDFDQGRRQWTYTLARVGCVEPEILYQRIFADDEPGAFEVADLFASPLRPLLLTEPDRGLSRLDLSSATPAEPVLWLSGEDLWRGVLAAHGDEVPFSLREMGEVQEARFLNASLHPLDEETFIAQIEFGITFTHRDRVDRFSLIVKLEEDGSMEVLSSPSQQDIDAELTIFPVEGMFQVGGVVFPLRDLPVAELHAESFPIDLLYRRMFGHDPEEPGRRLVFDADGRHVTDHRVLTTRPALADFDRDGLSAERERELGTSDHDPDSDGDGLLDGLEVSFGLDPGKAQSGPSTGSVEAMGFSNVIMEWEPMSRVRMVDGALRRDLLSHFFYPFEPAARVTCKFPIGASRYGWAGTCYDHELDEVAQVDLGKAQPRFISSEEVFSPVKGRVNIYTGEVVPEPIELSQRSFLGNTRAGGLILAPTGTLLDRSEIFYQREPGQPPVTLQLTGTPVDLESISWVHHLGASHDGSFEFFAVDVSLGRTFTGAGLSERWMYAVRGEEVLGLFELRGLLMRVGVSPWDAGAYAFGKIVGSEKPGGYILRLDKRNTRESIYVMLDELFRVTSSQSMPRMDIGAWWREGFLSMSTYRYRVALASSGKPDSRCVSLDGVIACDAEPGMIYMASAEIDETNYQQLVPLTAGLGPDDVLLSVHQDGLWRYTPEGAVSPWLVGDAIDRLRARSGVVTPIEDFDALALRRDRRAVCVISEGNLFTISLDERGVPEHLEHIALASEQASACTWDATSKAIVWAERSGKIFSGDRTERLDLGKEIHTIFSASDGRLLSVDTSGAMRCHSASGEAMGSVGAIVGATLFDEELLYVDREFLGPGLLSLDALCDGGAQDVASVWKTNPGVQFWTHIYAKVQGSILTSQRVNARRSDLAVVARDQILITALEVDTSGFVGTVQPVPFRIRPAYSELSEELEALVGESPYHTGMVFRAAPLNILAMANAPDASLDRSSAYHAEPSLPEEDEMPTPALDMGQDPGGGGDDAPGGCACQSASGAPGEGGFTAMWLLCLVFSWRRSRRR